MDDKDLSQMQLELVSFEKDRQKLFETMVSRPLVVSAIAADRSQFLFEVQKIERSHLYLVFQGGERRKPAAPEKVTITFGLDEGQFFIQSMLESVAGELFMIPIGEKLYRMQRRSNFRAPVPASMQAAFRLRKVEGGLHDHDLKVTDISGGGVGLLVPKGRTLPAVPGDEVRGILQLKGRDPIELEGVIRHIWPPDVDGEVKVGMQIRSKSTEQERELVAICMQIHRELYSLFRGFNR